MSEKEKPTLKKILNKAEKEGKEKREEVTNKIRKKLIFWKKDQ